MASLSELLDAQDIKGLKDLIEVEAIKKGVAECRTGWMLERHRKHSYEVLLERADLTQRELEARRLQKLVDEFAGRATALRVAV